MYMMKESGKETSDVASIRKDVITYPSLIKKVREPIFMLNNLWHLWASFSFKTYIGLCMKSGGGIEKLKLYYGIEKPLFSEAQTET